MAGLPLTQDRWAQRRVGDPVIRAIWQASGLGTIRKIELLTLGSRNESYLVDGGWVIRFNTNDPKFDKFVNEQAAYDLLAGSGLPVPSVILLDDSRNLSPYDTLILTLLPGEAIAASQGNLNQQEIESLAFQAGQFLARLHRYTFSGFGKLRWRGNWPFNTWPAMFWDYAARYLEPALAAGLLTEEELVRLVAVLEQAEPTLAAVKRASLVHSDYHYENILHQSDRVTGLLDFEWAYAGDPASDFVAAQERERVLPGSEPAFRAGYEAIRPLPPGMEARVRLYRLFLHLESAVTAHEWGDFDTRQSELQALAADLADIEATGSL